MDIDMILDEYRMSDPDKRMSLFLYHRELRDEFTCIEQDDPMDVIVASCTAEPIAPGMFKRFFVLLQDQSRRLLPRSPLDRTGQ